jgi:anti-sigma B factor antagonist
VPPIPFDIESDFDGLKARLRVSGELDISTVPQLQEAVETALARGSRELVVDLGELAFVDSSWLREFIVLDERARAEGWDFGLHRPSEAAMAVFRVSGMEDNLPFVEDPRPA